MAPLRASSSGMAARSVMNRASRIPPHLALRHPWMATHVGFMGNQRPRRHGRAGHPRICSAGRPRRARRAVQAGFDIVYVYAGMGYLPYEFLLPE